MKKVYLFLTLLLCSVGMSWAQFTWTNSSTAITTEAWASADNWTCADGTTFPTGGAGPMTSNSDAWKMVYITGASGTVADLEGWNPKMTLDATTLTVENMRKMQGGDKNFTLKNGSTLSITLHKSNSGNDGSTVPITFTGNGNTFNLILAGNMGGDGTTVNYGAVTDASTNKYNVSSSASGTARTFNSLTLKATIEGESTAETNTLHSVVLGNISSDITVTTLTYDITADNFNKAEGVLTASTEDAGKYSVVKGADGNVTLYWVTGPNAAAVSLLEKAFAGTTNVNDGVLTVNASSSTISTNSEGNILIYNASGVTTLDATSGTSRPAGTVSFRINLKTPTAFSNLFTWSTSESKAVSGNVGVGLSTDLKVQGTWGGNAWTNLSTEVLSAGSHIITVVMGQSDNSYGTRVYVDGTKAAENTGLKTSNTTYKYVVVDAALAKRVNAMYVWNKALTADEVTTVNTEIGNIEIPVIFPNNEKVYTIKGYTDTSLNAYYDGTNNYIRINGTAGDTDNYKWAIYEVDGKTYLYNIGAQKLVYQTSGTGASNNWNLSADVAHAMIIAKTGDYYTIHSEYCTGTYDYLHYNSGYTYGSTNWTADGNNSKWVIAEVGDLDASVASAIETMINDNKFSLPEVGKHYKITGIVGDVKEYISLQDGARVASQTASNPMTAKDVWIITQGSAAGKYYIKNAYDETLYFGFDGVSTTAYDWQMEISTDPTKKNWFSLYGVAKSRYLGVGTNNMVGNDLYAGNKQTNTAWNSYYYSTNFEIEPVDVYTLTINTEPCVAGVFTWNGETKRGTSVTFSHISGTPVDNSAISFTENGYTAELSEETWNGESNLTITATMSESFFSSLYGDKWVRITSAINANAAMYATEHMGTENINVTNDAELFCFVGNANDGFQIFNKAKGEGYALYVKNGEESISNGTEPSWVDAGEGSTWYLDVTYLGAASQPGYGLTTEQTPAHSLNLWQGTVGNGAKFWNNGPDNGGSRWFIQQVDELTLNIACEGTKSEMNQLVGGFSYTADGVTTTTNVTYALLDKISTMYLPVAKSRTLNENSFYTYKGYELKSKEATENSITVTYTATDARWLFQTYQKGRPYRIPSITKAMNGDLIAISDDRYCGADIGYGRVDLVYKVSHNNGKTWSAETMLAQGNGIDTSRVCGYGDAAMVADRESNKVMVMCVSAPKNGTCWTAAQRSSILWGEAKADGTWTWTTPVDIKDEIMALLPSDRVNYFVGSGKLHQSRYIKVGQYYRVYAALWTTAGSDLKNYVVYSDELGAQGSWRLLGSKDVCPGPNGNEPKCEELPNGDVLLSARQPYHRLHNIFHYTDAATGEGSWGTSATGINNNDGPNGTDGEILIINAKKSDGTIHPVALQSAPNNGRANVSMWYKVLDEATDYDTPANFGTGWTLSKQFCNYSSCYTTMCVQADKKIAFFYEDGQTGAGYDMIYMPLSISEVTEGNYTEIVPEETFNLTVTDAKYATLCLPFNAIAPVGCTVYSGTYEDEKVTLNPVTGVLPKEEGFVVKASAAGDYRFTQTLASSGAVEGNSLKGVLESATIETVANGGTPYILNKNQTTGKVQFNKATAGTTLGANKACLVVPATSVAQFISIIFGDEEATGLSEMKAASSKQQEDGKYIENCQLIIVKNGVKYNVSGQVIK